MIYTTYILYSDKLNRFYTGSTSLTIQDRLSYHLHNHKGFTSKAKDWKILYNRKFDNVEDARRHEQEIKGRGAKRFLNNLTR